MTSGAGERSIGWLVMLVGILPLVPLIWMEGIPRVEPRLVVTHLLAYLTVILLPCGLISQVGEWLTPSRVGEGNGDSASGKKCEERDGVRGKGGFHAGALIGALERTLIFILFLMTANRMLPLKDALGSLTLVIAAKALFRFSERTEEAEWYIVGTFLSLTSGVALSWFTLHLIWGGLG